jgi:hypothetical protein
VEVLATPFRSMLSGMSVEQAKVSLSSDIIEINHKRV